MLQSPRSPGCWSGHQLLIFVFYNFFFPDYLYNTCALQKIWNQESSKNKIKLVLQARYNHYQIWGIFPSIFFLFCICVCVFMYFTWNLQTSPWPHWIWWYLGNQGACYWYPSQGSLCGPQCFYRFHLPEWLPSCLFREFTAGDISVWGFQQLVTWI